MLFAAVLMLSAAAATLPPETVNADDCQFDSGWIVRYDTDPFPIRQGDTVEIRYSRTHGPDGEYAFSPKCLKKWKISDKRVKLSRDRTHFTVAADIPAGTEVTIAAEYGKTATFSLPFRVLGKDEVSLIGYWVEKSRQNCPGKRVAELAFSGTRFFYTFPEAMIESMSSGSGGYRWDQASGEMLMGEDLAKPKWRGTARYEGGELKFEGITFGGKPFSGPCKMIFVRR